MPFDPRIHAVPVDTDAQGSVTRFFEPFGDAASFAGDIALSGTRYGIAVGGFVTMSYAVHAAYFRIPFATLPTPQNVRDVVLGMGVGVLIGIVRAVRYERLGIAAGPVMSARSATCYPISRPAPAPVAQAPDPDA